MMMVVGDVVAQRVRHFRKLRGLGLETLHERCVALGAPSLTVSSLTNIERPPTGVDARPEATTSRGRTSSTAAAGAGATRKVRTRRSVSVEELFVLAQALEVPVSYTHLSRRAGESCPCS